MTLWIPTRLLIGFRQRAAGDRITGTCSRLEILPSNKLLKKGEGAFRPLPDRAGPIPPSQKTTELEVRTRNTTGLAPDRNRIIPGAFRVQPLGCSSTSSKQKV